MNKKFHIETYGCQMNVSDSEIVSSILLQNGYSLAESIDEADIIIFNTCSVRKHAEERVLGRISNEMSRKQSNPGLKIGVIGCMAQRLGDTIRTISNGVDFVAGVDSYRHLPAIIANSFQNSDFRTETDFDDMELYTEFKPLRNDDFNAFITIMRGCNNYCSYCIVPYLRGRERSRPIDDILKEAYQAGIDGCQDVTLLGQNVNSYNYNGVDFPDLLLRLNEIETIERIRFITSHPKDLSDKLTETIASCSKVCEHLHLALQSGDDKILKAMNRGYTYSQYLDRINYLRKLIPDIAITTDLIAGFPGETDEQFNNTLKAMQEIKFDFAFMFKYSARDGTVASKLYDSVPEEIKLERLNRMINLQNDITLQKYRAKVGNIEEVFVEKISKKSPDELSGKTRDFKIVVFPGKPDLIGTFQTIEIVSATGWTLRGELKNE
jgi:tRNA-2-methylthio-N6-dimethylallyladenosine synthase